MSTDNTIEVIKKCVGDDNRFVLINNSFKRFQAGNYDYVIRDSGLVFDEDIIVEVDGDDSLPDSDVFNRVRDYYRDNKTWVTYGQFMYANTRQIGFAAPVDFKNLRSSRFTATHLRTWKAWLWNSINQEDLKIDGRFPECSSDIFFMMPMLEMAGPERSKFVGDINYIYNFDNPIGDSKGYRLDLTTKFATLGRQKPIYKKLNK
jgi:glycosyltransferase involved in cell wall biosynthesis